MKVTGTKEAFEIMIKERGVYKKLGVDRRTVGNYKLSLKNESITLNKMEELLFKYGATVAKEKIWNLQSITHKKSNMKNYLIILAITSILFSCKKKDVSTPGNNLAPGQNAVLVSKYNDDGNIGISLKFTKPMSGECKFTMTDNGVTHTDSVYCSGNVNSTAFDSGFPLADSSIVTNFFVTVVSPNYPAIFITYQ